MTLQPQVSRPSTQLGDWIGFWLWALVGAGLVVGLISFVVFFLILPVVLAVLLVRRSRWRGGPVMVGMLAGAGLPLLLVAVLNWNDWDDRTIGDATPNPFYWGGVGLCLLVTGISVYEILRRRSR